MVSTYRTMEHALAGLNGPHIMVLTSSASSPPSPPSLRAMPDERCIPPWRKSHMTSRRRVIGASDPAATIPPSQSVPGGPIDYASAVLSCPSGIVITDPCRAGNPIVFVNQAFTDLTGYSSAEALGRNCRFLQGHSSDQRVIAELREALARGRPIRREILNYRKDGTQFWTDLAISPTFDRSGGLVGF